MASEPNEFDLPVHFFPPLYLQRRIWVLNVLRRECVTSVLDVGCAEGELLQALCQPAPWLEPPPDASDTDIALHRNEILSLHPACVAGLDVSAADLQFAVANTAPDAGARRWEALTAGVWEGGLECVNDEFVGTECIVATEVIEHLSEDILPYFAPVLLGVYRPRLLLITTPSYTFNARFTAPHSTQRSGYPDPTGRTDRVFRHHDHRFEWTVEEFSDYCTAAAREWGYEVACSTIGYATEKDAWGRDEQLGGASQVAEFRRHEGDAYAAMRADKCKDWMAKAKGKPGHRLLATHLHTAHPNARNPASLTDVGNAVRASMEAHREMFTRLEDLWFTDDIAVLCGGWIEHLTQAVEHDEQLELHRKDPSKRSTWLVQLVGAEGGMPERTLEELAQEMKIGEDYFPDVSGEWGPPVASTSSSRADTRRGPRIDSSGPGCDDADADDEDNESPVEWGPSNDGWGRGAGAWQTGASPEPWTAADVDEALGAAEAHPGES